MESPNPRILHAASVQLNLRFRTTPTRFGTQISRRHQTSRPRVRIGHDQIPYTFVVAFRKCLPRVGALEQSHDQDTGPILTFVARHKKGRDVGFAPEYASLVRLQMESGGAILAVKRQKMSTVGANDRKATAVRHIYHNTNLSLALMMASPKALVVPALKKHTATVIMAHGLGDRFVS